MDNQPTEKNEQSVTRDVTTEVASESPRESRLSNGGIIAGLVICGIFGVAGLIFGIIGLINSNQALSILSSNNIVYDEEIIEEAAADEAESSTYLYITYNDGNDFVTAGGGSILYYANGANGYSIDYSVDANTDEIGQYVMDNYLNNLSNNSDIEETKWSIELVTGDNSYMASGNEAAPEWFNDILNRLEVDKNGYLSRKVQSL